MPQNVTEKEFTITRVFKAPLDLVWKTHSEQEHLINWWGPKGLKMIKARLDFRVGGVFHYYMESPDGGSLWGRFLYREIAPKERIVFINSFSNEEGSVIAAPFDMIFPEEILYTVTFKEQDGKTKMTLVGRPINATAAEEQSFLNIFDSMNEGFNGTFDQLDTYLLKINS